MINFIQNNHQLKISHFFQYKNKDSILLPIDLVII